MGSRNHLQSNGQAALFRKTAKSLIAKTKCREIPQTCFPQGIRQWRKGSPRNKTLLSIKVGSSQPGYKARTVRMGREASQTSQFVLVTSGPCKSAIICKWKVKNKKNMKKGRCNSPYGHRGRQIVEGGGILGLFACLRLEKRMCLEMKPFHFRSIKPFSMLVLRADQVVALCLCTLAKAGESVTSISLVGRRMSMTPCLFTRPPVMKQTTYLRHALRVCSCSNQSTSKHCSYQGSCSICTV